MIQTSVSSAGHSFQTTYFFSLPKTDQLRVYLSWKIKIITRVLLKAKLGIEVFVSGTEPDQESRKSRLYRDQPHSILMCLHGLFFISKYKYIPCAFLICLSYVCLDHCFFVNNLPYFFLSLFIELECLFLSVWMDYSEFYLNGVSINKIFYSKTVLLVIFSCLFPETNCMLKAFSVFPRWEILKRISSAWRDVHESFKCVSCWRARSIRDELTGRYGFEHDFSPRIVVQYLRASAVKSLSFVKKGRRKKSAFI